MSEVPSGGGILKTSKKGSGGVYNLWGWIPLENCVTAVPENLIVNLVPCSPSPSTASSSSSKKGEGNSYSSGGGGTGNRVILGAAHLDTFILVEMSATSISELSSKPVQTIQIPSSLQNRCVIFRAKWISVWPSKWVSSSPLKLLLISTNLATFFYNEMGTKQIFKFDHFDEAAVEDDGDLSRCSRAMASTRESIVLGNDRGELHLFGVEFTGSSNHHRKSATSGANNTTISLLKTLKLCQEPIAEVCARSNGLVVLGTSTGSVSVWTGIHTSQPLKSFEYVLSKPEAVTGLILWYPYAIVSFGSGIVRMYNLVQRVLTCQVYAHARWISSMDLCRQSALLLTVAEDDEARIWALRRRLKAEQRSPIKLHSSIQIEDANFVGGRFLSSSGSAVALTNLGSKEIAVYSLTH